VVGIEPARALGGTRAGGTTDRMIDEEGKMARDVATRLGRPRVVCWNNMRAPYMVDRFNAFVRGNKIDFDA
jgi:hypothetical protein